MAGRTWDDYLSGNTRPVTREEPTDPERGLVGQFSDWYDQGIGKRWLPEPESYLGPVRNKLAEYVGEPVAKAAMFTPTTAAHAADFLFGTPADTASTLLTVGTLGAAAPIAYGGKAVQLASKAPKIYRAAQTAARGVDLIQGARAGAHAIESANKGDVKGTLLGTLGTVAGGYGASSKPYDAVEALARAGKVKEAQAALDAIEAQGTATYKAPPGVANVSRPVVAPPGTVDLTAAAADVTPPNQPSFLRATKPVVRAAEETEPFYSPFTASNAKFAARAPELTPEGKNAIFQSQQPLRTTNPNAPITDEARMLPEFTRDVVPPDPNSASVIGIRHGATLERARKELLNVGEVINAENLNRYLEDTDFRQRIQRANEQLGSTGRYEATVADNAVTPSGPAPKFPNEVAPETRGMVEAAGERVRAETGEAVDDVVLEGTSTTPTKPGVRTYYVRAEDVPLLDTPGPKGSKVSIRERADGTLGSWLERGKVKGYMKHHRDGGFVTPESAPAQGLVPVEVLPDGTSRIGKPIVDAPTTPPQVSGLRQTIADPLLASRPVVRDAAAVRDALAQRGVTAPTEEMVQKILNNPRQLDKVVPPTSELAPSGTGEFVPRASRPVEANRQLGTGAPALPEQTVEEFVATFGKDEAAGNARVKRRAPLDKGAMSKLEDMVRNSPYMPEREAAQAVLDRAKSESNLAGQPGKFGNFVRGVGMTMEEEFKRIGPTAHRVGKLITLTDTDAPIRYNEFKNATISPAEVKWARENPEEFEKVVDYAEGTVTRLPDNLKDLGDRIRSTMSSIGDEMVNLGLIEKKRADYWTHNFEGVPDATIKQKMRDAGFADDEITARLEGIRKHAEMKISEEYARSASGIPGYRKDVDVLLDHFRDVSKRVEQARNFGAKDLEDPNSQISKLIAASENPTRVRNLAQRSIRGAANVSDTQKALSKGARNWATMSQLSLSAISNMGGLVPIAVRGKLGDSAKALIAGVRNSAPDARVMNNVSEARNFSNAFGESMQGVDRLHNVYGVTGTQNLLNRVSGSLGSATADTLFQKLKGGKLSDNAAKQLEDLTQTDLKVLRGQDALSERQIQRSMVRMTDITQGSMNNVKLPYHWVRSDVLTIPQIFMRIAVQSSKAIKDAVLDNPATAIPKLVGAGYVVGELVGDTKEAVKTGAQIGTNHVQQWMGLADEDKEFLTEFGQNIGYSDDKDEQDRFSFTRKWLAKAYPPAAENDHIVRAISNLENAFALGLPGDIMSGFAEDFNTRDPNEVLSKTVQGTFWGADEAAQIVGAGKNALTGNFRDVGRFAVKRIPVVGRGIAREIDTTRQKENRGVGEPIPW